MRYLRRRLPLRQICHVAYHIPFPLWLSLGIVEGGDEDVLLNNKEHSGTSNTPVPVCCADTLIRHCRHCRHVGKCADTCRHCRHCPSALSARHVGTVGMSAPTCRHCRHALSLYRSLKKLNLHEVSANLPTLSADTADSRQPTLPTPPTCQQKCRQLSLPTLVSADTFLPVYFRTGVLQA